MSVRIRVDLDGPLFDARAHQVMKAYVKDAKQEVADAGHQAVLMQLGRVLRHPTGNYEGHIAIKARGKALVIHDKKIIYGWWLEGIGSRNSPVTRFPGYFTFRLVRQELQTRAASIAEMVLRDKYLGDLQ